MSRGLVLSSTKHQDVEIFFEDGGTRPWLRPLPEPGDNLVSINHRECLHRELADLLLGFLSEHG